MPRNDSRLERAKRFITIAESEDAKREAYLAAAQEIGACRADGMTWDTINDGLGRSERYAQRLMAWAERIPGDTSLAGTLPFEEAGERRVTRDGVAGTLRDPARRREALGQLTAEERAGVVGEALQDQATRRAVREDHDAHQAVVGTSREIIEDTLSHRDPHRPPIGHLGWTPRRWMADALFLLWRLQNRLVGDQPPNEEYRDEMLEMVAEARRHLDRVEAMAQGETVLDEDLAAAVARWEAEFSE